MAKEMRSLHVQSNGHFAKMNNPDKVVRQLGQLYDFYVKLSHFVFVAEEKDFDEKHSNTDSNPDK